MKIWLGGERGKEEKATYFIARTVAIVLVITVRTVFESIANGQLKQTRTSFASELIDRAC
jgi:hypothetical protein